MNWLKQNKALAGMGGAMGIAVVAFLAFGVFGIQTKFIDDEVGEAIPVFDSGAASTIESDVVSQEVTDDMNEFMSTEETPIEVAVDEPMPDMEDEPTDTAEVEVAAEAEVAAEVVAEEPVAEESAAPAAPVISTLVEGQFVPRSHPGSGNASVITDGSEQRFLRFEDFSTDNGPDLFVYLTTADAAADAGEFGVDGQFVNLGRLKGNVGEQNYEIDPSVDLSQFDTVVVWCDRFSVAFTAADLA